MGKELHGPCDVFLASLRHKNAVATVVLRRRVNVPAVDAVRHPGVAILRCFPQENIGARVHERCFIIIEAPLRSALAERFGLIREGRRRLRFVVASGIKWNHKCMGNLGWTLHSTARK